MIFGQQFNCLLANNHSDSIRVCIFDDSINFFNGINTLWAIGSFSQVGIHLALIWKTLSICHVPMKYFANNYNSISFQERSSGITDKTKI
jgi:hypothetical protein